VAGGLNTGISSFYMAIPFMAFAVFVGKIKLKNIFWVLVSGIVAIGSVVLSLTLERNAIVFPILKEGNIEIIRDAYHVTYSDGSGGLSDEKLSPGTFGDLTVTTVKAGAIYKVNGIQIGPLGFSNAINLKTELGIVSQYDYEGLAGDKPMAITNKTVHSPWAKKISYLMGWPLIIIIPLTLIAL